MTLGFRSTRKTNPPKKKNRVELFCVAKQKKFTQILFGGGGGGDDFEMF